MSQREEILDKFGVYFVVLLLHMSLCVSSNVVEFPGAKVDVVFIALDISVKKYIFYSDYKDGTILVNMAAFLNGNEIPRDCTVRISTNTCP